MAIKESPSASIAAEESQIAKAVLMPGDPLRAKYVADHYLEEVVCFNTVRNMLGYTGTYKGVPVSVMGSGIGHAVYRHLFLGAVHPIWRGKHHPHRFGGLVQPAGQGVRRGAGHQRIQRKQFMPKRRTAMTRT